MLALLLAAAAATAQPPAICAKLVDEIEARQMDMSVRPWQDLGDDSAIRATMRAALNGQDLQAIAVNLAVMRDNRCPAYGHVVSATAYLGSAGVCRTARAAAYKGVTTAPPEPRECDRKTWMRLD